MSTPNTINDGGPAFPIPHDVQAGLKNGTFGILYRHTGMSLRAYFAGQAMQGLLTQPAEPEFGPRHFAQAAVAAADALIAELNKTQQ